MKAQELNIGVDIGGTNIKFDIVDGEGRILGQKKIATDPRRGCEAILAAIVSEISSLLRESALRAQDLTSIGIGVPGTADSEHGTVVYAPNLFWRNVPIVPAVRPIFGVPVSIAQDTRAAAWAEYLVGSGRGLRGVAAVTLGTGIGCGMVIDGRIFYGALNTAGEFGHQIVELDGEPCNCGRHGCLEAHAGGLAIVRAAEKQISRLHALLEGKPEVDVADVYRLAEAGNLQARQLTDRALRYIGVGLVNLINLTSLEIICLSGGISNAPPELLLDPLIAFVRSRAYEMAAQRVRICHSALGEDAPLIGAALLHREPAQAALLQEGAALSSAH
ncbi:MAG TPA: ROK family protein [Acidobacteriaceae bacterium]|jgi:glucokinase|nr:ROK family protein [Acidobacteriaceae bacterium]